jgi:hypothetical protein
LAIGISAAALHGGSYGLSHPSRQRESKDSNDRLEAKVDALQEAIDRLSSEQRTGERGREQERA